MKTSFRYTVRYPAPGAALSGAAPRVGGELGHARADDENIWGP
ncbi:hypothetical protein [Streptomyces sp. NBC_01508]